MRNTKQNASIQSMNNENLNLDAKIQGKCNALGCRRIDYNELYGKSIPIENEMRPVCLKRKFKLCRICLLSRPVFVIQREDIPPCSMDALHVAT